MHVKGPLNMLLDFFLIALGAHLGVTLMTFRLCVVATCLVVNLYVDILALLSRSFLPDMVEVLLEDNTHVFMP